MALNPNTTGAIGTPDTTTIYYQKTLLSRLESKLCFDKPLMKKSLPKNSGDTMRFTRYDNLAANTTPLTEGVVGNGLTLSDTHVNAKPLQYGDYVTLSDLLVMERIDPIIKEASEVLGYRAGLSVDTNIRNTLHNSVTNQFANGAANEAAITAADKHSAAEVRKAVRALRSANCEEFDGGQFIHIIHPRQEFDLLGDSATGSYLDINKYVSKEPMMKGEIGKMWGVTFLRSSNVQMVNNGTTDVYRSFMFSKEGAGMIDLEGMGLKMYIKNPGANDTSNPLDQYSTVGYKFSQVVPVLDSARIIEIFSAAS